MDKKVVRKNTGQTTPKKTRIKKTTPTVPKKKASVNKEAVKKVQVKKEPKIAIENTECRHCHKLFEKGLSICPYCRKSQKDQTGSIIIAVLSIILLICIIGNHFINTFYNEPINESDYKFNCKLTSYEDLVRSPKDFKNTDIKVIGKVIKVEGMDISNGNAMKITIDANLFSGNNKQLITFEYTDKNYEVGFIEGDIVTVYGKYKSINGNTPFVEAKYIVFGT